ncbi:MAG: hypothetical protein ACEPOW_00500 [Bacteroidales bacterium]
MNREKKTFVILFIICSLCTFHSCKKKTLSSKIPEISFLSFEKIIPTEGNIVHKGIVTFSYSDGNGDIGLKQNDTLGIHSKGQEHYYNLWINYQEMQNGKWKDIQLIDPVSKEEIFFHTRIPVLLPYEQEQIIKGEISDTIFIYNPLSKYDTIRFSLQIADRELNKSNIIITPMIIRTK